MTILDALEWPASWQSHPLCRIAPRVQRTGRSDFEPLSVFLDEGVVPRSSREDNYNRLGEDLDKYLLVEPGDIVFNKLRTWQGGLGVSKHTGIVSPAYFVCRPSRGVEPRFLHFLLRSTPYLQELTRISKWMPPSQFDIGWDQLRLLPVFLPDRGTQQAIADFLDGETARLDTLVGHNRRLLALLEERVDARILRHIAESQLGTDGGHTTSIRRVLTRVRRPAMSEEVVTAYRDGTVTARSLRRAEGYTEASDESANFQGIDEGDVAVHGLDGFAGAIGVAEVAGKCSPVYHVCTPVPGGDPDYLARLLRLLAITGYLETFTTSTRERAYDFRNWELFGRIPIPATRPDEQASIGETIRRLRPLKGATERSVALTNERRQSLITAVVTGELGVSGAAA